MFRGVMSSLGGGKGGNSIVDSSANHIRLGNQAGATLGADDTYNIAIGNSALDGADNPACCDWKRAVDGSTRRWSRIAEVERQRFAFNCQGQFARQWLVGFRAGVTVDVVRELVRSVRHALDQSTQTESVRLDVLVEHRKDRVGAVFVDERVEALLAEVERRGRDDEPHGRACRSCSWTC